MANLETKAFITFVIMLVMNFFFGLMMAQAEGGADMSTRPVIQLPEPKQEGAISLEHTLQHRRTIREFSNRSIALVDLSQLLWAAQGITHPGGLRNAPSAGALYPLEIHAVVGKVDGLAPGVYRYQPQQHQLSKQMDGDLRTEIASSALDQNWLNQAAVILVMSAVEQRTTQKYGQRGIRYVYIEVGHAAQNVLLQAVSLKLNAAVVGAFDDNQLNQMLKLPSGENSLYIIPVGK